MSGTMLAGLLAAVLNGPESDTTRYVVRIDHASVRYVEGDPEPEAMLHEVEVVSSADGSLDMRSQFGPEMIEFSGVVNAAENGKLHVEVQYAYLEEVASDSLPEILGMQTSAKLNLEEAVVIGRLETRSTDVIDGVTTTRLRRDSVELSVRPRSEIGNRRRIE